MLGNRFLPAPPCCFYYWMFSLQVKMQFSDETVLPGAETKISLSAAPGSLCSIGVVDKSVNILGGDHQITPETVI